MLYDVYLINSNNYFDPISLNVNCLLAWEMEHKKIYSSTFLYIHTSANLPNNWGSLVKSKENFSLGFPVQNTVDQKLLIKQIGPNSKRRF